MASGNTTTEKCALEGDEESGLLWTVTYKRPRMSSVEQGSPNQTLDVPSYDKGVRVRTLKAGSVEKLVAHLAPYRTAIDVSYRTCFLATYRTFITTTKLIELLKDRLMRMAPQPSDSAEEVTEKKAVQSAIISFIWIWIDTYRMDFYSPPTHPDLCTLELLSEEWTELVETVEETRKEIGRKTLSLDGDKLLNDISSKSWLGSGGHTFSLFSLSAQDFVHSLTAEDKYVFQSVLPHQCLSYSRSPHSAHAPTVRAAIHHFNRVSLVTMATVLGSEGGAEERGRVLGRWVEIAQHCRLVKNFSSLLAVLSGLQSSPIFRLRRSWESVPRDKMSLLEELAPLFAADDNFFVSRDLLCREGTSKHVEITHKKRLQPEKAMGVIPYLGMFLTDLTMTHTAFPDTIKSESAGDPELINFEKRRREFQILAQLTLYQKSASLYAFPHNPHLVQWLSTSPVLSHQHSHELSQKLEPDAETAHLSPPPTTDMSLRHTLRRTIQQFFKATVGESCQHSHFPDSPLHDLSARDCSSGGREPQPSRLRQGDSSISPRLVRRLKGDGGSRTVRVAVEGSQMCLYRTISVTEADRAGAVVREAMKKHGIQGDPCQYHLQLLNHRNESRRLSNDTNIFYALTDSAVLLLSHNK